MVTVADDEALARMLRRTQALVEVESPSGDADGLRAAFDLLAEMVAEISGRPAEVSVVDGVPHLHLPATRRPSVLLLGHLDTVWPRGTLARIPFAIDDGRLTGPGSFDMKAGLVIALEALQQAERSGQVGLLVTGDEEVGSGASRGIIEAIVPSVDVVLVLEGAAPGGAMKVARKGVSNYDFTISGRAAHAGLEPEAGHNATVELAELVLDLVALSDVSVGTTVSPTVASSGTTRNTVPDRAVLYVDVRAWTSTELERVDTAIRTRTPAVDGVTIEVSGGVNRGPMQPGQADELVCLARQAAGDVGMGEVGAVAVGGASDGNLTAALGIPTLDGLGADGGGAHSDHEWVDVASLVQRARWVARVIDLITAPR